MQENFRGSEKILLSIEIVAAVRMTPGADAVSRLDDGETVSSSGESFPARRYLTVAREPIQNRRKPPPRTAFLIARPGSCSRIVHAEDTHPARAPEQFLLKPGEETASR